MKILGFSFSLQSLERKGERRAYVACSNVLISAYILVKFLHYTVITRLTYMHCVSEQILISATRSTVPQHIHNAIEKEPRLNNSYVDFKNKSA